MAALIGSLRGAIPGDAKPSTKQVDVAIHLMPDPSTSVPALEAATRNELKDRTYLTMDEAIKALAPLPGLIDSAKSHLAAHGFQNISFDPLRGAVTGTGGPPEAASAFRVDLRQGVRADGSAVHSYSGAVDLPDSLAGGSTSVTGLHQVASQARAPSSAPSSPPSLDYLPRAWPDDYKTIFSFPADVALGQTVGLLQLGTGGYFPEDLAGYCRTHKLEVPDVETFGATTDSWTATAAAAAWMFGKDQHIPQPDSILAPVWTLAASMQMQAVASLAPRARILLGFTEDNQGGAEGLCQLLVNALHARSVPTVVSINPGYLPESTLTKTDVAPVERLLSVYALMGITVCAASGDYGYDAALGNGPDPEYPATSTKTLGVGAAMYEVTPGGPVDLEVFRQHIASPVGQMASGGGYSSFFDRPRYQSGFVSGEKAGSPDVSGPGMTQNGLEIQAARTLGATGGTACASAVWASIIACMNLHLPHQAGFITPLLYNRRVAGTFLDVRAGNNNLSGNGPYAAATGWDPCTGLGLPYATRLLAALK